MEERREDGLYDATVLFEDNTNFKNLGAITEFSTKSRSLRAYSDDDEHKTAISQHQLQYYDHLSTAEMHRVASLSLHSGIVKPEIWKATWGATR